MHGVQPTPGGGTLYPKPWFGPRRSLVNLNNHRPLRHHYYQPFSPYSKNKFCTLSNLKFAIPSENHGPYNKFLFLLKKKGPKNKIPLLQFHNRLTLCLFWCKIFVEVKYFTCKIFARKYFHFIVFGRIHKNAMQNIF